MADITPPPHICGHGIPPAARADRDRWVASLPPSTSVDRICAMLGLSRPWVIRLYPHLAMVRAPETITPARKSLSIEERIEVIRQIWIKMRKAA